MSVPMPMSAMPSATATADPELDPPDTRSGSVACRTAPNGLRTPTSPVANWSRLVLPRTTAPASTSAWTAGAVTGAGPGRPAGSVAKDGHAAVVGSPATSTLSLTASVEPGQRQHRTGGEPGVDRPGGGDRATDSGSRVIQTSGRSTSAIRA